jgi:putative Holliday junction resolvase
MSGMPDAAYPRAQGNAQPFTHFPSFDPPAMQGTILAFDFGEKRIGVAIGESSLHTAHPLTTIDAIGNAARTGAIAALVSEWKPIAFVVGLPVHMDGTEHVMTERARKFGRRLEGVFHLPVRFVDERLTTRDATLLLREAGLDSRKAKPVRDQVAAQRILQTYFDTLAQ